MTRIIDVPGVAPIYVRIAASIAALDAAARRELTAAQVETVSRAAMTSSDPARAVFDAVIEILGPKSYWVHERTADNVNLGPEVRFATHREAESAMRAAQDYVSPERMSVEESTKPANTTFAEWNNGGI